MLFFFPIRWQSVLKPPSESLSSDKPYDTRVQAAHYVAIDNANQRVGQVIVAHVAVTRLTIGW